MTDNTPKPSNAMTSIALRAGTEFVSAIIVGVIFGLAIDHFFSTKPFGLIIMILLGAATGFRNIFKLVSQNSPTLESTVSQEKPRGPEKK